MFQGAQTCYGATVIDGEDESIPKGKLCGFLEVIKKDISLKV